MLIDFFERRDKPMTEFEGSAFESIVEKIVVIDQHIRRLTTVTR